MKTNIYTNQLESMYSNIAKGNVTSTQLNNMASDISDVKSIFHAEEEIFLKAQKNINIRNSSVKNSFQISDYALGKVSKANIASNKRASIKAGMIQSNIRATKNSSNLIMDRLDKEFERIITNKTLSDNIEDENYISNTNNLNNASISNRRSSYKPQSITNNQYNNNMKRKSSVLSIDKKSVMYNNTNNNSSRHRQSIGSLQMNSNKSLNSFISKQQQNTQFSSPKKTLKKNNSTVSYNIHKNHNNNINNINNTNLHTIEDYNSPDKKHTHYKNKISKSKSKSKSKDKILIKDKEYNINIDSPNDRSLEDNSNIDVFNNEKNENIENSNKTLKHVQSTNAFLNHGNKPSDTLYTQTTRVVTANTNKKIKKTNTIMFSYRDNPYANINTDIPFRTTLQSGNTYTSNTNNTNDFEYINLSPIKKYTNITMNINKVNEMEINPDDMRNTNTNMNTIDVDNTPINNNNLNNNTAILTNKATRSHTIHQNFNSPKLQIKSSFIQGLNQAIHKSSFGGLNNDMENDLQANNTNTNKYSPKRKKYIISETSKTSGKSITNYNQFKRKFTKSDTMDSIQFGFANMKGYNKTLETKEEDELDEDNDSVDIINDENQIHVNEYDNDTGTCISTGNGTGKRNKKSNKNTNFNTVKNRKVKIKDLFIRRRDNMNNTIKKGTEKNKVQLNFFKFLQTNTNNLNNNKKKKTNNNRSKNSHKSYKSMKSMKSYKSNKSSKSCVSVISRSNRKNKNLITSIYTNTNNRPENKLNINKTISVDTNKVKSFMDIIKEVGKKNDLQQRKVLQYKQIIKRHFKNNPNNIDNITHPDNNNNSNNPTTPITTLEAKEHQVKKLGHVLGLKLMGYEKTNKFIQNTKKALRKPKMNNNTTVYRQDTKWMKNPLRKEETIFNIENTDLFNNSEHITIKGGNPKLKNVEKLNNYLIRGFNMGDRANPMKTSKRNFDLTQYCYGELDERKKRNLIDDYDNINYSNMDKNIKEDNNNPSNSNTNNLTNINNNNTNNLTNNNNNNTTNLQGNINNNCSTNFQYNSVSNIHTKITNNLNNNQNKESYPTTPSLSTQNKNHPLSSTNILLNKKEEDRKFKEKCKQDANKLCNLINDISIDYNLYQPEGDDAIPINRPLNLDNLSRIRRVLKIQKEKRDIYNDNLGVEDLELFKRNLETNNDSIIKTLNKLGPPKFLKTKFRKTTTDKYKQITGKYFGRGRL